MKKLILSILLLMYMAVPTQAIVLRMDQMQAQGGLFSSATFRFQTTASGELGINTLFSLPQWNLDSPYAFVVHQSSPSAGSAYMYANTTFLAGPKAQAFVLAPSTSDQTAPPFRVINNETTRTTQMVVGGRDTGYDFNGSFSLNNGPDSILVADSSAVRIGLASATIPLTVNGAIHITGLTSASGGVWFDTAGATSMSMLMTPTTFNAGTWNGSAWTAANIAITPTAAGFNSGNNNILLSTSDGSYFYNGAGAIIAHVNTAGNAFASGNLYLDGGGFIYGDTTDVYPSIQFSNNGLTVDVPIKSGFGPSAVNIGSGGGGSNMSSIQATTTTFYNIASFRISAPTIRASGTLYADAFGLTGSTLAASYTVTFPTVAGGVCEMVYRYGANIYSESNCP